MIRKIAQGIGASLVAALLKLTGYNEALGADQTLETAVSVRNLSVLLVLCGAVIMVLSLFFVYNISEKNTADVSDALIKSKE